MRCQTPYALFNLQHTIIVNPSTCLYLDIFGNSWFPRTMSAPISNNNEGGGDVVAQQEASPQQHEEQHQYPDTSQAPTLAGDHGDILPPGIETTTGRESAEGGGDLTRVASRESRRFPLVAPEARKSEDDAAVEENETELVQIPRKEANLARFSTLSGRNLDLDQVFHIRDSIQLSIEDPTLRESLERKSLQNASDGASSSIYTLTHEELPGEADACSQHEQHGDDNNSNDTRQLPAGAAVETVVFTSKDEKEMHHVEHVDDGRASFSSIDFSEEPTETIVAWEENDAENPYNWPSLTKSRILATAVMLILNSTMGSALPSNAIPFIAAEWGITDRFQKVLPISVYLIGYVMGPILWGPLSEQYGRKRLSVGTFALFSISTLACALAPTWSSFLGFRLLAGVFASAPLAVVTGIIADIYNDPRIRGRSMGIFMVSTVFGPLLAPIISGFCTTSIGWRWAFWIALIYAGITMIALLFMPETFSPVLLLRRAQSLRRANPTSTSRIIAPHELEAKTPKELITVVLTRPVRMILFEPIVNTSCAYLALCYAIFYMSFEAYPIIFQGVYNLSPGLCGLTYLSIGAGSLLALPVFFLYDNILSRARQRNASWTHQEEYRRLPLACIGGPMFVISLFWLGWTSREDVHMFIPLLAGIPFGLGFMCVFQALLNYLTDAYEIFAASAHAASSTTRSLLATVLPLAAGPMFGRLGISGACSVLGGASLIMCVVPFFFLWQGDRIRANSGFCIALRERKEEMARRVEEQHARERLHLERQSRIQKKITGETWATSSCDEEGESCRLGGLKDKEAPVGVLERIEESASESASGSGSASSEPVPVVVLVEDIVIKQDV